MVIDLFGNDKLNKEFSRADNYINKRSFTLNANITELKQYLSADCSNPEFIKFRDEVIKEVCSERECEKFVGSFSDNHFNLELLGLEKNSRKYMVLVDFSESLDYILHLLSHCDMKNVRAIPNYKEISKAFLNGDMDTLAKETYTNFIKCDPALTKYMVDLYLEILYSYSDNENLLNKYIVIFYKKILEQTKAAKAYIMTYLRSFDSDFRYKSKTYAASLGTTNTKITDTNLLLKVNGYDDYSLPLQVYTKYEYLKKLEKEG